MSSAGLLETKVSIPPPSQELISQQPRPFPWVVGSCCRDGSQRSWLQRRTKHARWTGHTERSQSVWLFFSMERALQISPPNARPADGHALRLAPESYRDVIAQQPASQPALSADRIFSCGQPATCSTYPCVVRLLLRGPLPIGVAGSYSLAAGRYCIFSTRSFPEKSSAALAAAGLKVGIEGSPATS